MEGTGRCGGVWMREDKKTRAKVGCKRQGAQALLTDSCIFSSSPLFSRSPLFLPHYSSLPLSLQAVVPSTSVVSTLRRSFLYHLKSSQQLQIAHLSLRTFLLSSPPACRPLFLFNFLTIAFQNIDVLTGDQNKSGYHNLFCSKIHTHTTH